jgi:diaminopimelate epimerase
VGALSFAKYEGLGNDFVVVDAETDSLVSTARARAICDRRFGIGADGVLLVLPPNDAANAARMKVINADGSVPEMCGNGLRCVAVHVARSRGVERGELSFETDAGVKRCAIDGDVVTVDMGVVKVLEKRRIEVEDDHVDVLCADAGNPHAILFGEFTREHIDALGPFIATHPTFARGTNVEFASVKNGGIDLVVWERGVGVTLACGTGACATVAVAVAKGMVRPAEPIAVRLPGGTLHVTIEPASGRAIMRGPARRVFAGAAAL